MLYIIRHGKTDWNELHKLQGHTDIPLNANGIAMAENAAKEYKNVHFDVCYCSPLTRARQTADIILRDRDEKVPVIIDDRLIEMCFGEYEGIQGYTDDAGYNVNTLFARTGEFLDTIIKPELAKGKDILIVGHGAMNSSIICQVRGKSYEHFWDEAIENCKLKCLIS